MMYALVYTNSATLAVNGLRLVRYLWRFHIVYLHSFFFFHKDMFYKNIEAEIWEIVRMS